MTNDFVGENLRRTDRQYINCVSLGWFCGTASSLSKLGLRSRSGPFDWYFSHYWAVLSQIENKFQDFMKKTNLEIVDNNPLVFRDKKYGFQCNHDVKKDFEKEYDEIYKRYRRRVDAFMKEIQSPTIFFRCVRDLEEVDYINNHWEYAENLLKGFNSKNKIVYVYREGLEALPKEVESYCLNIQQYIGKTYEMRHMYDKSDGLLDFCASILPFDIMQRNVKFDNTQNAQSATAAYVNKCVEENIDGIDVLLLKAMNVPRQEGFYLWGAGKLGLPLAQYLRSRGVTIQGIVDNNASGINVTEFSIIPFEVLKNGAKIFIAVSNKDANNSIEKQIHDKLKGVTVVRYLDLYEEDLKV